MSRQTACSVGHVIKRRVEAACAASVLCGACVSRWGALLGARLARVAARADALHAHAHLTHTAARALDLAARGDGWAGAAALLARDAGALRTAAAALVARHAAPALRAEFDAAAHHAPCPSDLRLHIKAKTLVERSVPGAHDILSSVLLYMLYYYYWLWVACRLRDSWQHLVRDRATRSLTYNDEQFHVLERITVAETGRRARALLQKAAPLARARADAIADW